MHASTQAQAGTGIRWVHTAVCVVAMTSGVRGVPVIAGSNLPEWRHLRLRRLLQQSSGALLRGRCIYPGVLHQRGEATGFHS